MKLYVWKNVLWDYTPGIAFALANSEREAKLLIIKKYVDDQVKLFDFLKPAEVELEMKKQLCEDPEVYENPVGFYRYGGS